LVAACGIWCFGFQVVGMVWSWGLCVWFAGCCCCLKHVEQAIRSAKKNIRYIYLAFYFHILTTMHVQNHLKNENIIY